MSFIEFCFNAVAIIWLLRCYIRIDMLERQLKALKQETLQKEHGKGY